MTLRILNNAAIVGIGYIVGIRYAAIICAGSFLSYFVLVPLVHAIGTTSQRCLPPGSIPIAEMSIDEVFRYYVRIIGVGGIAGAGILGILSFTALDGPLHRRQHRRHEQPGRTRRDRGAARSTARCRAASPSSAW